MYCQYCGESLTEESSRAGRCAACGELVRTTSAGLWPGLFLITLVALVAVVVMHFGSAAADTQTAAAAEELAPALPVEYVLPASFGDIGPRLVDAGAIDVDQFVATYDQAGQPLTESQLAILGEGSDGAIVFDGRNAYFLLNFFWALGLTNDNPILTEGELMTATDGDPSGLASVGGWTIGRRPAAELYASAHLVHLTNEQQGWVEEVARNVYRPCCNNHTAFADCNHGMALLGLLQLVASQGATTEELYEAAKYVSAFWYPQQATETALFFEKTMNLAYDDVEPRMAVGREVFSSAGFQQVRQWLATNNALPQQGGGSSSCGV